MNRTNVHILYDLVTDMTFTLGVAITTRKVMDNLEEVDNQLVAQFLCSVTTLWYSLHKKMYVSVGGDI